MLDVVQVQWRCICKKILIARHVCGIFGTIYGVVSIRALISSWEPRKISLVRVGKEEDAFLRGAFSSVSRTGLFRTSHEMWEGIAPSFFSRERNRG